MTTRQTTASRFLIFGLPLFIILFSVGLAISPLIDNHPELVTGITLDLVLTAPLVYWLLIRKTTISRLTVIRFLVPGVLLATLLLPAQPWLLQVKTYAIPVIEMVVLSVIVLKARSVARSWKTPPAEQRDGLVMIQRLCREVIGSPKAAAIFAFELSVVYYAFFSRRKQAPSSPVFTNYKESGIIALLGAVIFMIVMETTVVHLLLERWNAIVAWVLSAAGLYTGLQFFAHIRAIRQRPSVLSGSELRLKCGLFANVNIDIRNIERIAATSNPVEDPDRKTAKLSLLGNLESHNLAIYLKEPVRMEKAYGIVRTCDVVLCYIDEPKRLEELIDEAFNNKNTDGRNIAQ